MDNITILIETLPCPICGLPSTLELDKAAFSLWQRGTLIQEAFPDMPKENRELLITGTHPTCWNKLF